MTELPILEDEFGKAVLGPEPKARHPYKMRGLRLSTYTAHCGLTFVTKNTPYDHSKMSCVTSSDKDRGCSILFYFLNSAGHGPRPVVTKMLHLRDSGVTWQKL